MNNSHDSLVHDVRAALDSPSGEVARAVRKRAGLSISRLAEALGVHSSTVSRWERGLVTPRPSLRSSYADLIRALSSEIGE